MMQICLTPVKLNLTMMMMMIVKLKYSNSQTSMLKSHLWDYSYAYIIVKRTISATTQAGDNKNKDRKITFQNCVPFTDFISGISNTQIKVKICLRY